jgi:hypothetical protein
MLVKNFPRGELHRPALSVQILFDCVKFNKGLAPDISGYE